MPEQPGKMRGARKVERHKLLSLHPQEELIGVPENWGIVPPQLSMWGNSQYGCCVTTEEAFAISVYSLMCGLPQVFITEAEVIRWARQKNYLNGADLQEVMDSMQRDGLNNQTGVNEKDGPYKGVDYSNPALLNSATYTGPIKIAIDADALPDDAGNRTGWYALKKGRFPNTDHCVSLSCFGRADFIYDLFKVSLPSAISPSTFGRALFTWNTMGFVTDDWLMGTCVESYVRNPNTVGFPAPSPGPGPTPTPTPIPGALYALQRGVDGSYNFVPTVSGGPIQVKPTTTVQELIDSMTPSGSQMAFPPFIMNILKFICPFAPLIPPPMGPILVGLCAILPHAKLMPDGSSVVTLTPQLVTQIGALRNTSQVQLPNLPPEVGQFEGWLRNQSSFQSTFRPTSGCAGCD